MVLVANACLNTDTMSRLTMSLPVRILLVRSALAAPRQMSMLVANCAVCRFT